MTGSREQRDLMQRWYDHTGFEFMGCDDVRANDPEGFVRQWNHNVEWLRDVATEADGFITEYKNKHL